MPDSTQSLLEGKKLIQLGNTEGLPERQFAVLGSSTLDYLPPLLVSALRGTGLYGKVYLAPFNQWRQQILDPASGVYSCSPNVIVLIPSLEDLLPDLFAGPLNAARQMEIASQGLCSLQDLIRMALSRLPSAEFYLVIPAIDHAPGEFVIEPADSFRSQLVLERFLTDLKALSLRTPRLRCVDWDWHQRRMGADRYRDDRLWYMARMHLNLDGLKAIADLLIRHYAAAYLPCVKLVAVDLDNTLWGGVAGEDGWEKLELGSEGVGLAFVDFQNELVRLRQTGVLLAICSKNDEATAWQVFEHHPEMRLRRDHFSTYRVNWSDKAENLASIAQELSIGLDSVLFLDDDPVQRALVRSRTPSVVPELPEDPCRRPRFLRSIAALHRLGLTQEDTDRGRLYQQRSEREKLKSSFKSLEDFLLSLRQEAAIARLNVHTLPRASQLCRKTNQFNLTTRRYTDGELSAMVSDERKRAYTLGLRDNFGDSGIVGFAVLALTGQDAEIEAFLLSCRVLGRKVENCFLSFLASVAREAGAKTLTGRFIPTEKNLQARDFYPHRGFIACEEQGVFSFDLASEFPSPPEIRVVVETRETAVPSI